MNEYTKNYYRREYKRKTNEELIEEILKLMEALNNRRAMQVDKEWISKYNEVSKNSYLFSSELVKDNQFLKGRIVHLEDLLDNALKELEEKRNKNGN